VNDHGVNALRYAYRTKSIKGEHFYGHPADCHAAWPIHYFTWVVVDEDHGSIVPGHDPLVIERHEPVSGTGDRIIRFRPPIHNRAAERASHE
jgi:hypothetical protein